ncbi:hypothetical protein [Gilvimarinus polysaccharolyticus]|uniref:hypothetical protein n=1 Tax=Gilvimarinus polysaccharolyticus TaxID=863921 RepID=UPI0006734A7C|nr:hypothetical protein [Gilvimarinus polysaccharolyticus]
MTLTISFNSIARICAGLLLTSALGACQSTAMPEPVPALLVAPNEATQTQLTSIISAALNTKVTLSAQALTNDPVLMIDTSRRPRSLSSAGAQDSWLGRPDHFELYLTKGKCLLKHRQSEQEWFMPEATCKAVSGKR